MTHSARNSRRGAAPAPKAGTDRRDFLKQAVAASAVLAAGAGVSARSASAPAEEPKLPQMKLGPHSISRLICGANPFNAGSHLSVFVNRQMREYYTPEQVLKTLRRCQEVGINCWQSTLMNGDLHRRLLDGGGKMHFISLANEPSEIDKLKAVGCIAVAHHGEVTDSLFKQGKLDRVHDLLKRIRDGGMLAGVSTHMPDVVDAVESKGWDLDFYMTCAYERHRSERELKKLLGYVPIPVPEVYLAEDPPRMFKAVRATKRPCLVFKILAAGRLSERPDWVERAFKQTFESIKPGDGVIVGIYDKYDDQPAQCAEFVRRFAAGGPAAGQA